MPCAASSRPQHGRIAGREGTARGHRPPADRAQAAGAAAFTCARARAPRRGAILLLPHPAPPASSPPGPSHLPCPTCRVPPALPHVPRPTSPTPPRPAPPAAHGSRRAGPHVLQRAGRPDGHQVYCLWQRAQQKRRQLRLPARRRWAAALCPHEQLPSQVPRAARLCIGLLHDSHATGVASVLGPAIAGCSMNRAPSPARIVPLSHALPQPRASTTGTSCVPRTSTPSRRSGKLPAGGPCTADRHLGAMANVYTA